MSYIGFGLPSEKPSPSLNKRIKKMEQRLRTSADTLNSIRRLELTKTERIRLTTTSLSTLEAHLSELKSCLNSDGSQPT